MIYLADIHGKGVQGGTHYIGRESRDGRHQRSPLHNPFTVERVGMQALRLYRLHIVHALATADPAIVSELAALEKLVGEGDITLGCWCCTRPANIEGLGHNVPMHLCHGDIVATVLTHWGVRLATYARARGDGDTTGPERWATWVARDCGPHPHAVLAFVFGAAEFRAMAAITAPDLRGLHEHEVARMLHIAELVAAGMPSWMQR